MHGSVGSVLKPLPHQLLVRVRPEQTVRDSDVVEVGDVQYVAEHEKLGLPCCSRSTSSPGKSKKRRAPVSPGFVKKQFSVSSPSASRPSFESALQKSFEKSGARRSGHDRRNAPVFQGGYQQQFNCIFV